MSRNRMRSLLIAFTCAAVGYTATVARSATLFGLTDTGEMFASSNAGVTWAVVSALPLSDAVAIAAGETSNELFLVSKSGVVYRSSNAGVNWTAVGAVAASDVVDMAIRTNGHMFLLSATGTVWLSRDEGVTFAAIATLTASNHVALTGDTGGGNMYALTQTGEVARGMDFGSTWNTVGTIATSEAVDIRALGQTLYVLTGSGDVARSTNNGVTWMFVGTISQVHMSGLTSYQGGLVAITREGDVASSSDATAWTFVGSMNQLNVVAIGNDTPTITGVSDQPPRLTDLRIRSVWPNPAGALHTSVAAAFDLPQPAQITLYTYNVLGQLVATQEAGVYPAGEEHRVTVGVGALPSGVYYLRLVTSTGQNAHSKLVIVR